MTLTTWHRADGWGVVDRPDDHEHGGRLYAAPLSTGEIIVLEGAAAVVARAALGGGDAAAVRRAAAADLGVGQEDVDADVVGDLLHEFVSLGLLERR